jgi:glycosyltransferase involved in cell wall biosynthesis
LPLFSVIIPSYNRGALIAATLASVFAQDFRDFEIIVADDGSTDDSLLRLRPYLDRITLLHQANLGPGAARNLGIRHGTGEYIAFLDSDDLWFPWTLASYAKIIEEKGRPTLIAGKLAHFHQESELDQLTMTPLELEVYANYFASSRRMDWFGTGQMVVRRDVLLQVGCLAEGNFNAEDHDLVMRLGMASGFVNVTSPALIGYRKHVGAVTKDVSKTFTGLSYLLQMEQNGRYPGGEERRSDRRRIIARHVRPATLELLRLGEYKKAWVLYRQTFVWNLLLGKFRFLLGFFFKAAQARLTSLFA